LHDELTRRCVATTRDGPCKNYPVIGGTVCRKHGGGAPQTLAAARRALAELREPAIGVLNDFIQSQPTCEHCGRSDNPSVRLRAALQVLNRTGLAETLHVEVDDKRDDQENLTTDELAERARYLLELAAEIRAKELESMNTIEGVVVDTK
jgi:hypothetical protein